MTILLNIPAIEYIFRISTRRLLETSQRLVPECRKNDAVGAKNPALKWVIHFDALLLKHQSSSVIFQSISAPLPGNEKKKDNSAPKLNQVMANEEYTHFSLIK